ncbi:MAG: FG-GAP-like repeat-containing protein [Planctomycetota bacterium]
MTGLSRGAAALILASLPTAGAALGQDTLFTFDGPAPGDVLGTSIAPAGDVNADGVPDVIVGVPGDDNAAPNAGSAIVLSGADGTVLLTVYGIAAGDELGRAVGGAGDVDADGHDDIVVGAPLSDGAGPDCGAVRVFSGFDGTLLFEAEGAAPGERFGAAVAGAGDVDADGTPDVVVGAPGAAQGGAARVLSGATGQEVLEITGGGPLDQLGAAVDGAGDLDGDGRADLVVGAPGSGDLVAVSGSTGGVLFARAGLMPSDGFGVAVAGVGDVDGDGVDDVAGGSPASDYVLVLSGSDGSTLTTLTGAPGEGFGFSVAGAGDVNGDGVADVVVGADTAEPNGLRSGRAAVLSGGTWQALFEVNGASAFERLGAAVAGVGDLDGDGFDDVAIGAPDDRPNGFNSGSLRAVGGSDRVGVDYCASGGNSIGLVAALRANGSAVLANQDLVLTVTDLPPNRTGYFLTSQTQGNVPGAGGSAGVLCLGGSVGRYVGPGQVQDSGSAGTFTLMVDTSALPQPTGAVSAMSGETWNFQSWYRDVLAGLGIPTSNFSNGLAVTFL